MDRGASNGERAGCLCCLIVVVLLSDVDCGDPRCPIHGEDAIFTQSSVTTVTLNQRNIFLGLLVHDTVHFQL